MIILGPGEQRIHGFYMPSTPCEDPSAITIIHDTKRGIRHLNKILEEVPKERKKNVRSEL